MAQDARRYMCTHVKSSHQAPKGFLHPLKLPHRPRSHIAIDSVVGLPESNGNTVIMTIIDHFLRMAHFILITKLSSAAETGELLVQHVFCLHGLTQDIVSDRGPQFTSQVWRSFCTPPASHQDTTQS